MSVKIKIKTIIQYILIYFTIATGGSAWTSFLGNDLFILSIFVIGALFLLFYKKGINYYA